MLKTNGTKPTEETTAAQPSPQIQEPTVELSEEQELARLTQLQRSRQAARMHAAQQAIATICQQYRVQLVARPQFTPDGRVVAPVALAPLDE